MFEAVKKFFAKGLNDINEVMIRPLIRLSFYQKCFLIITAGLLLYMPYVNGFNATHDEKYTLLMCRFDVLRMIKIIAVEDGHPPFSYLYAKFWIWLFGLDIHHIFALRLATLFTFLLTALLGVFPLKRLLGEKVALIWIGLVFVLPSSFHLATNMRMYPLAVLFLSGEFMYAMLFVYQNKKYDLPWFFVFTVFALYTHYYCVILSAVIWLVVLCDLIRLKEHAKIIRLLLSGAVAALLYIPWLFAFLLQYQNMKDMWAVKKGYSYWAVYGALFSYVNFLEIYHEICLFLGVFCWILVFEFLLDGQKNKFEHIIVKRAVMVFWSIYAIAFVLSFVLRPTLWAAYLVIPVGLFYVGIAVSFLHFKKFRPLFYIMIGTVFIMGYSENYKRVQDDGYKQTKEYIEQKLPQNTLVLYRYGSDHLLMMLDGPAVDIYYIPTEKYIVLFQDEVEEEDRHLKNLDKYDHFYTVTSMFDFEDFIDCEARFMSEYDQFSYCFKEISKDEAMRAIERTKKIRKESFHEKSLKLW